jgi:hypothetical protein
MVESDYKNNRVSDPTAKISAKHEKTVKNYCQSYFHKAAEKYAARDSEKPQSSQSQDATTNPGTEEPSTDMKMSDNEIAAVEGASSPLPDDDSFLKRKRDSATGLDGTLDGASSPYKQQKSVPPPPPPPPPPAGAPVDYDDGDTDMDNAGERMSPTEHDAMETDL